MRKIRWGVLSTSKFAREKVIPSVQKGKHTEVVAIASRSLPSAEQTAKALGIPKAHGSYEALLADPDVDVIYNPLPNNLHVTWSVKAIEAGKHVLCEKPMALSAEEARTLLEASQKFPQQKIMEGFMYRHHPQWQHARALVRDGKIGSLKTIQCCFSYYNADPGNIRNKPDVGGGSMYDIGCYCVSQARFIFEREPVRVMGIVEVDAQLKTDTLSSGMLDFQTGTATFTCSTQLMPYQRVNILGTEGRIEIEIPFNAPLDSATKMWLHQKENTEEFSFAGNQYTIQGDLFAKAILDDTTVPTPLHDGVANMRVIDAFFLSAKKGTWQEV